MAQGLRAAVLSGTISFNTPDDDPDDLWGAGGSNQDPPGSGSGSGNGDAGDGSGNSGDSGAGNNGAGAGDTGSEGTGGTDDGDKGGNGDGNQDTDDDLTPEETTLVLDYLDKGAIGFDEDGNLVNDKEEVVLPADKVKEALGTVKPNYDDKGNLVDNQGNIIKTKEQLNGGNDKPLVAEDIIKNIGFEIKDETGKVKEYKNTTDGVLEYISDVIPQLKLQAQAELIEGNPRLKRYYENAVRLNVPDEEYFKNATDYTKLKPEEIKDNQFESFIRADLKEQGWDEARINSQLEMIRASKKEKEEAQNALKSLQKRQVQREIDNRKNFESLEQQKLDKIKSHWEGIENTVVKTGKINEFTIPLAQRQQFFDYLSKAVDENKRSQAQVDYLSLPLNERLMLDYMLFRKKSLSNVVNLDVFKAAAKRVRRLQTISKNNSRTGGSGNGSPVKFTNDIPDSPDDLF